MENHPPVRLAPVFAGSVRAAACGLAIGVPFLLLAGPATAQTATPTAEFQYSALTGSSSVVTAARVPVTNSGGAVSYWDVTITFNVSAGGVPSAAASSITRSQKLLVGSFQAGTYAASTDTNYKVVVAGAGVAAGGTTQWSLSSSGAVCQFPATGQWWTGPIADNPLAARITAAKITSKDFSYGSLGTGSNCWPFAQGNLIGVAQVNNTLTFEDFTDSSHADQSFPQATTTFTLQ